MYEKHEPSALFHGLHHAHKRRVAEEQARRGLEEVGAPWLLVTLFHAEERGERWSQRDVARTMRTSPATVAVSLKNLEGKGYLLRITDEGDQRRNRIHLTEKGRNAVERGTEAFQAVEKQMLAGFSGEEKERLTGFFVRMLENLGAREEDGPPPPPGGPGGPPSHHHRRGCGGKECERR